jgi:hypothetical protein
MDFPEEDLFLPKRCVNPFFRLLAVGDVTNITLYQPCPVDEIYIRIDMLPGLGFYRNIIVMNNAALVQILHCRLEITHIGTCQ